jgi:hypothetical protein
LWRELLDANRAEQLYFDIFVETEDNQWARFSTITSKIAREKIDAYLVYRKIHPGHNIWRQMGIYQRNLENFDESVVLENGYFRRGCLNCHTFCGNNPDKMLIGLRSKIYGSSALLVEEGDAKKIATKFGYSSFHPARLKHREDLPGYFQKGPPGNLSCLVAGWPLPVFLQRAHLMV